MIVVDSSVWIDFLNGRNAAHVWRLRAVLGTNDIHQTFFNRVFADQRHPVPGGDRPRERGLARARESCNNDEVNLAHAAECATLRPGAS